MTKKIGITGQNGFIGYHLYQTLKLHADEFELVDFERRYFEAPEKLDRFVAQCDVIVHLAALNRHNNPEVIYSTNTWLVKKLVASLKRTNSTAHILISSSTQEERDNLYGLSKREGREMLAEWAEESDGTFTGMVIPNVFGPFGDPHYNSVVATFCHQVSHGEQPEIKVDGLLKLIYVGELAEEMIRVIREKTQASKHQVQYAAEAKVSEILSLLEYYRAVYQEKGEIPELNNTFEHQLFNTYRCYMPKKGYFPRAFTKHSDDRGHFVELARLGIAGQMSFSTTVPGITRGNHFHTRKIERFAVIKGTARIQLRRIGTDEVMDFFLNGEDPAYVDMPIWYTHNITNVGEDELLTVFWIDEPYNPEDADTYFEIV